MRGSGPILVEVKGEMGKDNRKRLPRWSIHISGTKGLGSIGRVLAQGEGKGYLQIVLSERSATSATPSMQIVGGGVIAKFAAYTLVLDRTSLY